MTYWKLSLETKVLVWGRSAHRENRKQVSLEIKIRGGDAKRERERKKDKTNVGSERKERKIENERNDVWKGNGVDPFM